MSRTHSFVVAVKRSPIGHFMGSLSKLKAVEIGSQVAKGLVAETKLPPAAIDEVYIGQVLQAGCGQNPARQVALGAGIPDAISCTTVNKVCGSSLQAVMFADLAVRSGEAGVVLAGGIESMSNAPFLVRNMRAGHKFGNAELVDVMAYDGLTDVYSNFAMGIIAEETASKAGVSRQNQDEFSVRSHQRAAEAERAGRFNAVRVPITVPKADAPFARDETVRGDIALDKLAALRPAFDKNGSVTAGNASTISDGAAMVLVASEAACSKHNLKPLARITSQATSGGPPKELFFAPIAASKMACEKAGWDRKQVDLWEMNEAFAAQMCACLKGLEMPLDSANVNVDGGAIALGHPIGASGARIVGQLIWALKHRNLKRGVASACLGGGNAVAMALELV
ncbi:MAG: thiolase family protein [Planctomycetes bacterium]|nr:thiolase family protein [Planctomycetota bacterium]